MRAVLIMVLILAGWCVVNSNAKDEPVSVLVNPVDGEYSKVNLPASQKAEPVSSSDQDGEGVPVVDDKDFVEPNWDKDEKEVKPAGRWVERKVKVGTRKVQKLRQAWRDT